MKRIHIVFMLAAFSWTGCSQGQGMQWSSRFHEESGHAVLDTDKFTLVFEGVPMKLPTGMQGGGAGGSFQVSGPGKSKITLTTLNQSLTNSYADGVNTVSLGKYQATIKENGRLLEIAGKTFELGGAKQRIVVHKDGSAERDEAGDG